MEVPCLPLVKSKQFKLDRLFEPAHMGKQIFDNMRARKVVTALMHVQRVEFLLQLRDFSDSIIYPGHWGLFGGSINVDESSDEAIFRELYEELRFVPKRIDFFSRFDIASDNAEIFVYCCEFDSKFYKFTLREGQEFNWFSLSEIFSDILISKKHSRNFPATPPLKFILTEFLLNPLQESEKDDCE